jgi:hypothetical protein
VRELIKLKTKDGITKYHGTKAVAFGPGVTVTWISMRTGDLWVGIAMDSSEIDVTKVEKAIEVRVVTDSPDEPVPQPV